MVFFGIAIYVLVIFFLIVDVVRQPVLSGGMKALFVAALLFLPVLGILAYGLWRVTRSRGLPSV